MGLADGISIQPVIEVQSSVVKVVGVGGCGGNVAQHVYDTGLRDVSFAICNTDRKALRDLTIPDKLQLGDGLGAGGDPETGLKIAESQLDAIRELFDDNPQMAFITAGLGKGTGTGAGPFVAHVAKSMDILSVGFVCLPPEIEGEHKMELALKGLEEMRRNTDAVVVVDTQRIFDLYSELSIEDAFDKADDLMADAAKAMVDIVVKSGRMTIDLADVRTALRNGGDVVMAYGRASGENRIEEALSKALNSPLLLQPKLSGAKDMLLNVMTSRKKSLYANELNVIRDYLRKKEGVDSKTNLILGVMVDDSLGDDLSITIVATGLRPVIRTHVKTSWEDDEEFVPAHASVGSFSDFGDMTEEDMLTPAYGRMN
ncbi:MAG: cell division FtsZ family protein [Paludibacteraceae bacterium]|nr:cell division FtsZ family protein [Paludibacteraceae bacterium]MBR4712466.1 cell division FtsZ family protein [Paludibacteraceae bacterium]